MRPLPLTIALILAVIASAHAHTLRTDFIEVTNSANTSQNAPQEDGGNHSWHSRISIDIMTVYLLFFDVASALILLVAWVRRRWGYGIGGVR